MNAAAMRAMVMRSAPLAIAGCARGRPRTAALYPEVVVQLGHVGVEVTVGDHVHHPAVLHHVVAVGDGGGEAEVLLDEEYGEPLTLESPQRGADLLHDHRGVHRTPRRAELPLDRKSTRLNSSH